MSNGVVPPFENRPRLPSNENGPRSRLRPPSYDLPFSFWIDCAMVKFSGRRKLMLLSARNCETEPRRCSHASGVISRSLLYWRIFASKPVVGTSLL